LIIPPGNESSFNLSTSAVFPIDGLGLDPDDAMVLAAAQLVLAFLSDPETNPKATTTIERELEQKAGEGCCWNGPSLG
jgi:hypothetical protein